MIYDYQNYNHDYVIVMYNRTSRHRTIYFDSVIVIIKRRCAYNRVNNDVIRQTDDV